MNNQISDNTKIQLLLYNFISIICYILIIVSVFVNSEKAEYIFKEIEYYLKLYMALYLIWRFNPYRKQINITILDRQIIYGSAFFILFVVVINKILLKHKDQIKSFYKKIKL